jgi:hypothetical protein
MFSKILQQHLNTAFTEVKRACMIRKKLETQVLLYVQLNWVFS